MLRKGSKAIVISQLYFLDDAYGIEVLCNSAQGKVREGVQKGRRERRRGRGCLLALGHDEVWWGCTKCALAACVWFVCVRMRVCDYAVLL